MTTFNPGSPCEAHWAQGQRSPAEILKFDRETADGHGEVVALVTHPLTGYEHVCIGDQVHEKVQIFWMDGRGRLSGDEYLELVNLTSSMESVD